MCSGEDSEGGGVLQLGDECGRSSWCLLRSAVKSVTFPWKEMCAQDVTIWYSVVVASYIEGLLENV